MEFFFIMDFMKKLRRVDARVSCGKIGHSIFFSSSNYVILEN